MLKKSQIAIIGLGHVGKTIKTLFPDSLIYDPAYPDLSSTKQQINDQCELAIISVWTGSNKDGSCDISIVEESVGWLNTPLILIKSTIAPGTTDYLKKKYKKAICFSPEYYGESSYFTPNEWKAKEWPFVIVGGDEIPTNKIFDIFLSILGPLKKYYSCTALEAELIKYMENTWGGMKVVFFNEMYEIVKKAGVNWYKVWEGWALDPRVEKMHSAVFSTNRGFSGKCLPKDILALIRYAESLGYDPKLIKQIIKSNKYFTSENKLAYKISKKQKGRLK